MIIKFIFSIVIIVCCSMLGGIYANTYTSRTKLLSQLLVSLQMLETEIIYSATPLPLLLTNIGRKSKPEIGNIFIKASEILLKKEGLTFNFMWSKIVDSEGQKTGLFDEDLELLKQLGNNLGTTDIDNQVKHIRLIMEEVRRNYQEAIIAENKNVKLYKQLGLLAGFAIAIILF
ncbi:sporulation protein [Alkaliphilus peptidifermentans]|uniref:Stage III sporulation protein AB n=1 Tax=Alkaliphilus peptidifermentans DSM 18978 TaxID=1120976 RepID=A0A1G5KD77_9FIRM|nr:sporulation protein [Alkaliphilus peptidifermentans]SCY98565.1 stage III sporulation protein AB [Alkaliphilus peptidifermentans DSM 18978]